MPLTPAERMKRYREKMKENDPDKYILQKRKNAERTNKNRKKISDYSLQEQENIRKQWRKYKKKGEGESSQKPEIVTSTDREQILKRKHDNYKHRIRKLAKENIELKKEQGDLKKTVKNLRKRLNGCIKKNNMLLELIQEKNKLISDFEEKLKRAQDNAEKKTPLSKTEAFIDQNLYDIRPEEKERVKKMLLQHHVFVETIKRSYQSKDTKEKRLLKDIFKKSGILEKYKMKTKMATYLGLKGKIRHTVKKNRSRLLQDYVRNFYERDDVSKMTAGKNEVKTHKRQKKQRRYLLGTLSKLHQKYRQEGGKLSFATFKRYRPFYVLPPKAENRDTCACKRHENLQIKATVLKSNGLIQTKDLDQLLALVVCDVKSRECAYGECVSCKNKLINFTTEDKNLNESISWDEWVLKPHKYKAKNSNVTKITKKIVKDKKSDSLKTLIKEFQEELQNFKTHSFNIIHQYKEYRRCIQNLDDCTVAIHIDFSENYACKLGTEIQSMHFGASRQQITLHTGILFTAEGNKSFASISPNNEHGPDAIWAHLLPVLKWIRKEFPFVDGINFFSDGPTVQYKQKKNFYYFSKLTKELGFPYSTWNFFEASHGKGAADGIGGAIKRKLDSFVAYGSDVTDAKIAYELLQKSETKIKLFYVPEDSILRESSSLDLMPVPNTMTIHQIINNADSDYSIFYRNLSCFCQKNKPGFCDCLNMKSANLLRQPKEDKTAPKKKVSILSDIKNTTENMAFFDLTQYGPFNGVVVDPKMKLKTINRNENDLPSVDISINKENNAKKRKHIDENLKKKKKNKTKLESSTDEDFYSLHDSSEDAFYITDDDDLDYIDNQVIKEKDNSCIAETTNKNKNFPNKTEEEKTEQMDIDQSGTDEFEMCYNDSVLVRYYQKCSWKYYIGFVEDVCLEEGQRFYSIRFLKTVKTPTIKFVIPRRKDHDTVTSISIVKKIEIKQNIERPKEYFLAADSDITYFK